METDVIARLPVPVLAMAQNRPSSADQQAAYQPFSAGLVRIDQLTASGEVIMRLPVPESLTAQKRPS